MQYVSTIPTIRMSSNIYQWNNPSAEHGTRAESLNIKYHDKNDVPIQKNNMRLRFKIVCIIGKTQVLYNYIGYVCMKYTSIAYKITYIYIW